MTDYSDGIVLEARKKGLRQASDKQGDWYDVTFQIHPDDAVNTDLAKWKLGTRVALVVTRIADGAEIATGEQTALPAPETAKEGLRLKGGDLSKRAGMLCRNESFQRYAATLAPRLPAVWETDEPSQPMTEEELAARWVVCAHSEVYSLRHLDHDRDAGNRFRMLEYAYRRVDRGETDAELQRQADAGP